MSFVLFFTLALIAIAAAAGLVTARNPVHSALFLLLNFASLAVMYLMLNAQFLAAAQIIVYAGAIVVLFLFVIMLMGWRVTDTVAPARAWTRGLAVGLGVLLVAALAYAALTPLASAVTTGAPDGGSTQAIGGALFTSYLLPFELTSVLLLVGIVGAIVLTAKPGK
mgnify:FL=1